MEEHGVLKWRFDVSTFRLIGRDLITDRVTALFELVKNCYDANATNVTIEFRNVQDVNVNSYISIIDNGIGMSFEDIRDKWMVIGTSSKRRNPYSPAPIRRRCVGEKGIGRFAVDKLGNSLKIVTKKAGDVSWLTVDVDWGQYYQQASSDAQQIKLFTDVENLYSYQPAQEATSSGTSLLITDVRDAWSKNDIIRLLRESARIVSPFVEQEYPFNIHIVAEEFNIDAYAEEYKVNAVDLATVSAQIEVKNGKQECMVFNEQTGNIDINLTDIKEFGGISMRLYYFDKKARDNYRKKFRDDKIDGVKIYRDGVITTPFAEREDSSDKKRDILGIDKRMWVSLFDKVSTREILGIVNITKEGNPEIVDATNRQDFSDTQEYRALKDFILLQISAFDEYKKYLLNKNKSEQTKKIQNAGLGVEKLIEMVDKLAQENPSLQQELSPLRNLAKQTSAKVQSAIIEQKEAEEERARHESMYMRIMSRQEDAINVTHAVKTSMGKIQRQANFFKERFPNVLLNKYFSLYAKQIHHEMLQLDRATDEIFNYSKTSMPFVDINIKQLVEYLLLSYSERFLEEKIKLEMDIDDNLILNCNEIFFYDIVQNITDNAIKAMRNQKQKRYRCTVKAKEDKLIMNFSDTGIGIPIEKREWVFGIYNTTTEELGGGGIGLYAVRMRVNSLNGKVCVTDSEFAPLGVMIHIELPFKRRI